MGRQEKAIWGAGGAIKLRVIYFQSCEKIGGHFADTFEPLRLFAQFLLAKSHEGRRFQTLNLPA
jgi:hypothetical protein